MKKILSLLLCCLMLSGCTAQKDAPVASDTEPPVITQSAPVTEPGVLETAAAETTVPDVTVSETAPPERFITLYAPNEDATGFVYTSWEVPELSAEVICGALIEAGVLKEDAAFNSITLDNSQVNLDVNEAFGRQLMSYGTTGEYMMVGSVVNTLLAAYAADTVFITCEGQIIESGHVIYDFPLEFYED